MAGDRAVLVPAAAELQISELHVATRGELEDLLRSGRRRSSQPSPPESQGARMLRNGATRAISLSSLGRDDRGHGQL